MEYVLGFTGTIIAFVIIVDILQTTFFLSGTGFLSGKISTMIWKILKIKPYILQPMLLGCLAPNSRKMINHGKSLNF